MDFSADLEFVLVEKKLVQVALHLRQSQVEVSVGEQAVADLSWGLVVDGTVHRDGEGAHQSLQAGDVSLDLIEGFWALQLVVQKCEVVADIS